jgi:hypothetical protein
MENKLKEQLTLPDQFLERFQTFGEYAKSNGITLKTVYNQIKTGKIPATRLYKFPIIKKTLILKREQKDLNELQKFIIS